MLLIEHSQSPGFRGSARSLLGMRLALVEDAEKQVNANKMYGEFTLVRYQEALITSICLDTM